MKKFIVHCSRNKEEGKEQDIVTENDLDHLLQLLEGRNGEAEWQTMMQRSTPNFAYEAWRLEPEVSDFEDVSLYYYLSFALFQICSALFFLFLLHLD